MKKISWVHSLGFKGTVALTSIALGLLMGTIAVINTDGRRLVLEESSKLLEQTGNHVVGNLQVRMEEISSLVRTIATTSKQLPKDASLFKKYLPPLFDFDGDLKVAGGGIWPEPYRFDKAVDRRSFFWGRENDGTLKYYDDYNNPDGKGYHNEEWYVAVRYTGPGRGFWSRSYMDPYSFQPMVTCTVGIYGEDRFEGTATVDLKLEGIVDFVKVWREKIGGYGILFDRNGKFISFPMAGNVAKTISIDEEEGNKSEEFLTADEFAERRYLFLPIADEVKKMNEYILLQSQKMPGYSPGLAKRINQDSYQINKEEALFISAVIMDPLKEQTHESWLFKKFEIENDLFLDEKSIAYLFHVPESYWKLVLVTPYSKATGVATGLVNKLLLKIGALIFLLTGFGYLGLVFFFIKPLSRTMRSAQNTNALIGAGKISELKGQKIETTSRDEIGALSRAFNQLSDGFARAHEIIEQQNLTLEEKVGERTRELKEEVAVRKKAEEGSRKASEAKSIFLSSMSHELRTPMNSILGFAQLLQTDLTDPLSGTQKENVEYILKSGKHLLVLIDEVLDLSRIESGRLQLSIEDIDVGAAIMETLATIGPLAEQYNITIVNRTEHDKQYIRADCTRLKQVIMNLLSNSIKYNKPDGSVVIWHELTSTDTVRVNIEDTGLGIAEEKLGSLFEPFNRLGAEALKVEGTGIGLTITKRLVRLMGGSIGVESKVGKGSKFYVDLKKAETPVESTGITKDVTDEKRLTGTKEVKTLLYVEDNPSNLILVENILKRRPDIKLLTAPQARLGIELARAHQPNMILMDVNLPGINGFEALKLLKDHGETKEIPVVAVSANAMPKDIEKGMAAGFKDYITKPININKFLEVVDKVLTTT